MRGIGQHESIPIVSRAIPNSQLVVFSDCSNHCATHIPLARFLKSRRYRELRGTVYLSSRSDQLECRTETIISLKNKVGSGLRFCDSSLRRPSADSRSSPPAYA